MKETLYQERTSNTKIRTYSKEIGLKVDNKKHKEICWFTYRGSKLHKTTRSMYCLIPSATSET